MLTQKYIESKNKYVFEKDGVYWALSPSEILEMNKLTGDLVLDAVQKICKQAVEEAEKPLKEWIAAEKKAAKIAEKF